MKKLTVVESQQLYDQTFERLASDDKCDIEISREVAVQFCQHLRIPDAINVVVMPFPQWHVGTGRENKISLVASSYRIGARPHTTALDICAFLENQMSQFYAERGEVCYLGLYWLPWKLYGDRLWWIRHALVHIDWKNNDYETGPYV